MASPDAPADADLDPPPAPSLNDGEGVTGETLPSDDIEALLAAAAAGSVQMPPEDDEGTDPEPADGSSHSTARSVDADGEEDATSNPALTGGDAFAEADYDSDDAAATDAPEAVERTAPPADDAPPATSIPMGGQVEKLLEEVEAEVRRGRRSVLAAGEDPPDALGRTSKLELEAFAENGPSSTGQSASGDALGSLDDVELDLRIELGRAEMSLEEVVALRDGSVVTLDKLAGDPVDILVNGRLVARGEVLVLNDNFCVRVAEILPPDR